MIGRPSMWPSGVALSILGLVGVMPVALAAAPAVDKAVAAKPGAASAPAKAGPGVPLLPGAGSKEPVNIDANKLDYYDKEQKLIYTGDVVAVQGDSTLKASVLTIFLQKDPQDGSGATAPAPGSAPATGAGAAPAAPGPAAGSSVRHMEAEGPVTLISKDQVGTGNHATYDKIENKIYLNGNVTLSQGTNVTQGDRLVYDLTSGQAQVFSGQTNGGRVKSVFTPGSGSPGTPADTAKPAPKKEKSPAPRHRAKAKAAPAAGVAAEQ